MSTFVFIDGVLPDRVDRGLNTPGLSCGSRRITSILPQSVAFQHNGYEYYIINNDISSVKRYVRVFCEFSRKKASSAAAWRALSAPANLRRNASVLFRAVSTQRFRHIRHRDRCLCPPQADQVPPKSDRPIQYHSTEPSNNASG